MKTHPVLVVVLGCLLVVVPVAEYFYVRHEQTTDTAGVNALGAQLKAVQQSLPLATSGADSTRIAADVKNRQFYLSQRSYHIPMRQHDLDRAWRLTGPSMIASAIGIALITLGLTQARRRR